ncbi:MAG: AraC family transcriptional regulator [Salinivirgaceae bacterium]|nr:AraC family transcriptional regulator [Salinivirgaceae bacterium]MDD4747231.1 AraC family transcriptional regulator [Salinivirgaceae bacterium]MDY0279574.1 AraC family transcriptional regulator [Salinivirgaceae bacterium]
MIKVEILLKNMLARSCIKLLEFAFKNKPAVIITHVELGKISLKYNPENITLEEIMFIINDLGFDSISDPEEIIVERIKQAAIELIFYANNTNSLIRNSDYISQKLQLPYQRLSKIFSRTTGKTLEKYIIMLKIEKAKEMIAKNQYSLSEIAFMLDYSSIQYLSNQFKTVAGVTLSEFKESPLKYRIPLEDLLS